MTRAGSPEAKRSFEDGLRRIRALVAVAVVGALILGGAAAVLAFRAYGNAKDDEVRRIETSALVTSGDYSQFLSGRTLVLQALASSDSLVRSDTAGVQARLARLKPAKELRLTQGVTWFDADSVARATKGADLTLGTESQGELRRTLAAARAGGTTQISGSIEESLYKVPVVVVVTPTFAADGRTVTGTLVGAIGTTWLSDRARLRSGVRGGDTQIYDRSGNLFVAPALEGVRQVGDLPVVQRIRAQPTRSLDKQVVGALTGVTNPLGQGDRVIGFATDPDVSGWTYLIDRSESAAFAGPRDTLRVELLILSLLVLLGIAGALLLGHRLAAQYRETRAAEDRTRRLQEMTAGLSAASTPDAVAQAVLALGQDVTGAVAGSIALLDEEGARLQTLALVGYSPKVGDAFASYPLDAALPTPESIRDGAVWLPGAAEVKERYPHLAEFQGSMTHEAVAALPMVVEGGPIGGLALSFPDRHEFGSDERAFLTTIAELSGQALDRSRLYELEQRKTERQQLLAEAGVMLDAPLGTRDTLTALTRLAVPRLADWCSVSIPAEDGIEVVAVAHVDPARVAVAEDMALRFPARADDEAGVAAVLRTGRAEFVPVITPEVVDAAVPPGEKRDAIHALGLRSVMTVPLIARGRILGALVLASAESGRRFTADDLAFAEDLGARAGLAIDNAMLLDQSRDIARTLQDSLLPARLPDVEGLDVAARYVAGGQGVEVGGDFYDLFRLDGDRGWAAVLGDVCGKGTEAAALTALARHTIRAESDQVGPGAVLGRLNRAILRESADSRFLTATYAWLRPGPGRLTGQLARGGHPPTLVVRADGSVETLCPRGPLLGIMQDITFAESDFELSRGDSLVLFSDGVLEARAANGDFFGLERLISIVSGLAGRGAEVIAGELDAALDRFQTAGARDDRAILIVRVAED